MDMNDVNIVQRFIQSARNRVWNSCNTRRAIPRKAGGRGSQFSVFSRRNFATFNVAPAETKIALNRSMVMSDTPSAD